MRLLLLLLLAAAKLLLVTGTSETPEDGKILHDKQDESIEIKGYTSSSFLGFGFKVSFVE